MTIVEKAAYLKGMTQGLGIESESRDGKLWGTLCDLLSDMAHEIEDLQECNSDFAGALDDISEDLSYLEELTSDLDMPEDDDDDDDDYDEDCDSCGCCCEDDIDEVLYDVCCPSCGEEITFNGDTLERGSIRCPKCGELMEFDTEGNVEEKKEEEEEDGE
ncbi:MAG: CD1247 N-terminal domain-containing protein [Candidatus Limivicinus sp.]|jgi:hypothetical protein